MILVSRSDFESLRKVGMIKFGKDEKNFTIVNKTKRGKQKKYYVVEEKRILNFLNRKKEI